MTTGIERVHLDRRTLLARGLTGGAVGAAVAVAGSVVSPSPADAATLVTVPAPTGNALQDTAAITNAVGAGKLVQLQAGTYLIAASINLPSGVTLQGEGMGVTRLKLAPGAPDRTHILVAGPTAIGTTSPLPEDRETVRVFNIALRDLTLDGNKAHVGDIVSQCARLTGVTSLVIERVHAKNSTGSGLCVLDDCNNVWITNCRASDCAEIGFLVQDTSSGSKGAGDDEDVTIGPIVIPRKPPVSENDHVVLTACISERNGNNGFGVTRSTNVVYNGCMALMNDGPGGFCVDSGRRITFNGCVAEGNGTLGLDPARESHGFSTWGAVATLQEYAEHYTFNGCISVGNQASGFLLGQGRAGTFTGCQATGNGRAGILVSGRGGEPTSFVAIGCLLSENAHGIDLLGVKEGVIADNVIWSNNGDGVIVRNHEPANSSSTGSTYITITGNHIFDPAPSPTQDYAIRSLGNSDHLAVIGNVSYGNAAAAPISLVGSNNDESDNVAL